MKNILTLATFLLSSIANNLCAQQRKEVAKMPLYEVFSSADCPNCALSNPILNQVLDERINKYVAIKNQLGFPHLGDPYYNKENDSRLIYYAISGIPSMAVNGVKKGDYKNFTTALFDEYAAETTPLIITSTYTQTDLKKFDVAVTLNAQAAISGKLKLFVVLCEKRTVKNIETNGETEFFHVAKKYINANGSKGMRIDTLIADVPQNISTSFEVKGDYRLPANGLNNLIDWSKEHSIEDFNNLEIAIFVQDSASKKVYQAAYSQKTSTDIKDAFSKNNNLTLYPDPAKDILNIHFTLERPTSLKLSIYNVLGSYVKTIAQSEFSTGDILPVDTSTLQQGAYFIKMHSKQGVLVKKLLIN